MIEKFSFYFDFGLQVMEPLLPQLTQACRGRERDRGSWEERKRGREVLSLRGRLPPIQNC